MYNSFEEEYIAQVQKIRELRQEGKEDEASLEQTKLGSINVVIGSEDLEELEVVYE
tara:strand:+ start:959 stop:1126 length:168 start_codon:yes stop_codon:yes gene_type:complete